MTLPPAQAAAIAAAGLVRVELDEPPDRWRLLADSRVGIVGGEGWELRVVPRLSIPRLMFLLGYALDPRGWRDLVAPMVIENDLFGAVAAGFAAHAHRALELGPLQGYVAILETSQVLRGRLRVGEQIGARGGLPLPLEIERDDYTMDIQENRLLAAATALLLRLSRIPRPARSRLRRIRTLLAEVSPPASLVVPAPSRLNRRYTPALALAALILRRLSVGTQRGAVASTSFVFDMNTVFEDFLTTAITDALQRFGGDIKPQFSGRFLDQERRLRLRPDITWWRGGEISAILDAKYKPLADQRFPNADAYQMLAYCQAFGLDHGTLVYAHDALDHPRSHTLPRGLTIDVRAIDVQREPADVLKQVDQLAADVVARAAG